jgi:hypothetical protein
MKNEVKVTISPALVQSKLQAAFEKAGEVNAELMARMITENLAVTEMGMGQLIFAFMGIEEKLPWLVGDTCLVHPDFISSWDCDKDGMIKEGFNMHRSHFIATIIDIDMRVERNIRFQFEGYEKGSSSGKTLKMIKGSTPATKIKLPLGLPASSTATEGKRENVADIL